MNENTEFVEEFGKLVAPEEKVEKKEKKKEKKKGKPVPRFMATWNMSEYIVKRADWCLIETEFYYKQIQQGEVRGYIMLFLANIKNLYSYIQTLGEDKPLERKIEEMEKMAKDYTRKARRRPSIKIPDELYDLVNYCLCRTKMTIQKQGWGMQAERKRTKEEEGMFGSLI